MATTPSNLKAEKDRISPGQASTAPVARPIQGNGDSPANGTVAKPATAPSAPRSTNAAAPPSDRAAVGQAGTPFVPPQDDHSVQRSGWVRMAPSWLASMIFHIIVLLVMAVWIDEVRNENRVEITASASESVELEELTSADIQPLDVTTLESSDMPQSAEDVVFAPSESFSESLNDELASNTTIELELDTGQWVGPSVLTQSISQGLGESLSGIRAGPSKSEAIRKGGGNAASEAAVAAALRWLASQQMSDGGWTFDLRRTPNPNKDPGQADQARAGATAMALLPFLGAGHTPREGKYAPVVRKGLLYLTRRGTPVSTRFGPGVSWHEPQGRMYSHGLASIAVCEAYAMTKDKSLQPYAQASINFIAAAQLFDGGWRYEPPPDQSGGGDTSVVGWQVMALKSASMGYHLSVSKPTLIRSYEFLNKVQSDEGAAYGYVTRNDRSNNGATTAIGLLCRMYFGWKKDHPALQRGIEVLSKRGPSTGSRTDMYYNYYATQVMRHWEGEEWEKWNEVMRDYLIEAQAKEGPEMGSWFFNDPSDHGAQGQRLYITSMATMTLEVYYRHLPLYQKSSTDAEFKP